MVESGPKKKTSTTTTTTANSKEIKQHALYLVKDLDGSLDFGNGRED